MSYRKKGSLPRRQAGAAGADPGLLAGAGATDRAADAVAASPAAARGAGVGVGAGVLEAVSEGVDVEESCVGLKSVHSARPFIYGSAI
jgi:hypothetical protein